MHGSPQFVHHLKAMRSNVINPNMVISASTWHTCNWDTPGQRVFILWKLIPSSWPSGTLSVSYTLQLPLRMVIISDVMKPSAPPWNKLSYFWISSQVKMLDKKMVAVSFCQSTSHRVTLHIIVGRETNQPIQVYWSPPFNYASCMAALNCL